MSSAVSPQFSRPMSPQMTALRTVTSPGAGTVNYINAREVSDPDLLLAEIGYKQELKRTYSTLQVFGIAFSIMGLLPSIATVLSIGLTGGPVTLIWGWFLAGIFILLVGVAMAELASAIPTSGGLYYWTYHYAPPKWKAISSFVIGVSNSMALVGSVCSVTYGFALQVLAAVYIAYDGDFTINSNIIYGVYAAGVVLQCFLACMSSAATSKLQTVSIVSNMFLIVLFVIAIPIGTAKNSSFNDAKFIFGNFTNYSDWPAGWAFFQFGMMPGVWTIAAFDSTVHMAEESRTPSRSIPIGIIGSIAACWIGGWLLCIVICACMGPDMDSILNTESGQPLIQIIYNSLGKRWAIAFSALTCFCQFLMSTSILVAISRQVWAFARDEGLPFSGWIKTVNKRLQVPLNSIIICAIASLIMGLLIIAGDTAANALFSISIIGNNVAYATPSILRFTSGKDIFKPGVFYTGDFWSPILNYSAIIYQVFIIILSMFPDAKAVGGPAEMNYSVVVNCGIWILALIYFVVYKKKTYHGPKSNLTDEDYDDIISHNAQSIEALLINNAVDHDKPQNKSDSSGASN